MQLIYALLFLATSLVSAQPMDMYMDTMPKNMTVTTAITSTASKMCTTMDIPLSVTSKHLSFDSVPEVTTQREAAQLAFQMFTQRNANPPTPSGSSNITENYTIHAVYCRPTNPGSKASTVQILTHGIGFDHTYWDLPIAPSNYSYVDYMISQGYSTLSYDRLGNALSSRPDPMNVQSFAELEILHQLTTLVRKDRSKSTKKVVHVGHSYGSILGAALAAAYPKDSDGLVLTGYSAEQNYTVAGLARWDLQLANRNQERLAELQNGYFTWADKNANQVFFLSAPGDTFSDEVLEYSESHKQPVSSGTLLSLSAISQMASSYEGPVHVITGMYDVPFCGGWCEGIIDGAKVNFPKASAFEATIHPNSGHAINGQFNATGAYKAIGNFLSSQV